MNKFLAFIYRVHLKHRQSIPQKTASLFKYFNSMKLLMQVIRLVVYNYYIFFSSLHNETIRLEIDEFYYNSKLKQT